MRDPLRREAGSGWTIGPWSSGRRDGHRHIVAVGADLYVADTFNNRIARIDTAGNVTTVVGGTGPGQTHGAGALAQLRYPTALTAGDGAL